MDASTDFLVGERLRELRQRREFSLRALAARSGLNVNTLSLIEKGKCSPSVSTLQQLAQALEAPITAFFATDPVKKKVVFAPAAGRDEAVFGGVRMTNLGRELAGNAVQPFEVQLEPGAGSGERLIVHTGHEFVYCLSGVVCYWVDGEEYRLEPGDGLTFEAHLPHRWLNPGPIAARILLVMNPADERDEPGGRHFDLD